MIMILMATGFIGFFIVLISQVLTTNQKNMALIQYQIELAATKKFVLHNVDCSQRCDQQVRMFSQYNDYFSLAVSCHPTRGANWLYAKIPARYKKSQDLLAKARKAVKWKTLFKINDGYYCEGARAQLGQTASQKVSLCNFGSELIGLDLHKKSIICSQ